MSLSNFVKRSQNLSLTNLFFISFLLVLTSLFAGQALGAPQTQGPVKILFIDGGDAQVKDPGAAEWHPAAKGGKVEKGAEVIANPYGKKMSTEQCYEFYSKNIDGVIAGTEDISSEVLKRSPSLKVISRCGIGLDNVDLETAKKRNISVFKTSSAVADAVAELSLGLMLDALRSISMTDRLLRKGDWQKPMGFLLKGKTIGIIGLGAVGKRLVELCAAFDCQFLATDTVRDEVFAKRFRLRYTKLDELLKTADIISIHLPFNPETNHLITHEKLKLMKKTGILINTARGNIVDEEALYKALKERNIAGAALDVFAEEPYTGELRELDNIILTSHIGSYARESRIAMELEAVDNLIKGLKLT